MEAVLEQAFQKAKPIIYDNSSVSLKPKYDIRKDLTRYVASFVDFIEPKDKIGLDSLGVRSGALRVGGSETEGCPTMRRTNYLIRRACFTPLELTAIPAKNDQRDKDALKSEVVTSGVNKGETPAPFFNVYPGDDIQTLTDDSWRAMGVVEISKLSGELWESGAAEKLNLFFFPELTLWLNGDKNFPEFLRIYEEIAGSVQPRDEVELITQGQILESIRQGRSYMTAQIEVNRARIESTRNLDMAGFSIGWTERTKLFARQLEMPLEDEKELKQVTVSAPADPLAERKLAAQEKANELAERRLALLEKPEAPETPPPLESREGKCTATIANGELCSKDAVKDGRCQLPAHKLETESE